MKRAAYYLQQLHFRLTFLRQIAWSLLVFLVFALVSVILLRSDNISTKPVGWEKSYLITSPGMTAKNVKVSSRGQYIAAVYEAVYKEQKGIYASISFNGGTKFLPPLLIAPVQSEIDTNPHAAVSSTGELTVMWQNLDEEASTNRIFMVTSLDMGATWTKPEQIKSGYDMEMLPKLFYDNKGTLHLFYHAFHNGAFNLFHALRKRVVVTPVEAAPEGEKAEGEARKGDIDRPKYKDTFVTTGSLITLTRDMKGAFFPSILLSGSKIFIVWQGKGRNFSDDLFFIRSTNNGSSWSSAERITKSKSNDASPSLLFDNDVLYLVYQNNDEKSWAIKLLRGYDNGAIWDDKPLTISATNADCYAPAIVRTTDGLLITWYDTREKQEKVFSRKYSLLDGKMKPELKLSLNNVVARNPIPVTTGNRVVIFWEEGNRVIVKFSDIYVRPPLVFSKTHPEGKWSRLPEAKIEWKQPEDESGIVGYATMVNKLPDFNPNIQDINNPNVIRRIIPELEDGMTYFHIRAIDGAGNYSRTIHYKVRSSINPLGMPIIISPTHKQGKSGKTNSPVFRWAIDDTDRLKGFVYSLSKGVPATPEKYIDKFELTFENLELGTYFFSLSAVDKTNQRSEIADYPIIIGEGSFDPAYFEKLARKETKRDRKKTRKRIVRKKPEIEINLPETAVAYSVKSLKGFITAKNIPGKNKNIEGYSVFWDNNEVRVRNSLGGERITQDSNIIILKDLQDGDHYIGARCRYYEIVRGKKKYSWTEPVVARFSVKLPVEESPIVSNAKTMIGKFPGRSGIAAILVLGLSIAITTLGFGTKIAFFSRLFGFKLKVLFRSLFIS